MFLLFYSKLKQAFEAMDRYWKNVRTKNKKFNNDKSGVNRLGSTSLSAFSVFVGFIATWKM